MPFCDAADRFDLDSPQQMALNDCIEMT